MKKIILLISLVFSLNANIESTKQLSFNIQTELKKYPSSLDISLTLEVDKTLNKKEIESKLKAVIINAVNMYDKSYFYSKTNSNQMLDLMLMHDVKHSFVRKNKKIKKVSTYSIKIINPLNSKIPSTKELYKKKCASCHGSKGLQKALGVSGQIASMNKNEIYKSLNGYKKHNLDKYGRASYMWRYIDNLNDKNLRDLSNYIDSL